MWMICLKRHFLSRKWKKYYKRIIFNVQCINFGLKPSFMWDFGPESVNPEYLSEFLEDLKKSCLICEDLFVITVDDINFISHKSNLMESIQNKHIFMDITRGEGEWFLSPTNTLMNDVIDRLKTVKQYSHSCIFPLPLANNDCLSAIFGLLLGYPLVYYFNLNYTNSSLSLVLFKVLCKFNFLHISQEFQVLSFSIPEILFNDNVDMAVNEWFHKIKNLNKGIFQDLRIEFSKEDVNSLNL